MKRWLGVILVVVFTAAAGWTQEPTASDVPATKEDIEKLFVAMHLRERMEDIIQNTRKQTKLVLTDLVNKQADVLTPKEISQLQRMMDDMIDDVYKDYPLEAILQDMVPVYQKHLTESDVNQLIAIYGSPIGQKLLREVPAMTSEAMQVSYARLQPKMGEIVGKLRKKMEQMVEEDQKQKDNKTK